MTPPSVDNGLTAHLSPGEDTLSRRLCITPGSVVSLIGGGGKTTIMMALAREQAGHVPVVLTTTTKIWPPEGMPLFLLDGNEHQPMGLVRAANQAEIAKITVGVSRARPFEPGVTDRTQDGRVQLAPTPCASRLDVESVRSVVAIGKNLGPDGKVHGIDPGHVCSLQSPDSIILCEADGSAGRSVKVHGPHEPVIPSCCTHLLLVMGADALGHPADDARIHRLPEYHRHFGTGSHLLTPSILAGVAIHALQRVPPSVRMAVLINKAEVDPSGATELSTRLRAADPTLQVVMTSWARLYSVETSTKI